MVLKGATFDWWGTIAAVPAHEEDTAMRELRISRLDEILRRNGIDSDRSVLYRAYDRQGELLEAAWADQRELEPREQVQAFLRFAGIVRKDPWIPAAVADAFGSAILTRPPTLFPHIRDTLDELKGRGFAIGLISNTGRSWGRYLTMLQEALGIGKYFDVRVYSDEQRTRKPDPQMFEAALTRLRLKPDEVVHVGDDVTADVAVAKAVGMRAVWFNTGFWPGATTDRADAEIVDHQELLRVLEAHGF